MTAWWYLKSVNGEQDRGNALLDELIFGMNSGERREKSFFRMNQNSSELFLQKTKVYQSECNFWHTEKHLNKSEQMAE